VYRDNDGKDRLPIRLIESHTSRLLLTSPMGTGDETEKQQSGA
jgi:hypothetical protein